MIEGLKPYAEYKASGLPLLGAVPIHWEVKRLKNWVTINEVALPESTPSDFEFDYLDIGSVGTGRLTKTLSRQRFSGSPSRARRVIRPGDTIVSTVRTYLKAVLTIGVVDKPLIASTGFAVLTPRGETIPKCLGYVTQSQSFTNEVTAESVGIAYPAISETKLANIPVTLPPPDEQAAIVRFLDHANRKIDGFIRAKRKLIGLLNEQKQAIIHRAVTRGLQPDVPLKPSGIPWLGDIPMHWEISRACRLFRQVTRYVATGDEPKMSMSRHYGLIRSSELSNRAAQAATSIKFSVCIPDDLVLNKYQAHNGLFGAAIEKGLITSNYSVFKPLNGAYTPYFAALFASPTYRGEFRMRCQGVGDGMMPLYSDAFLKTPTIAPPVEEQRAIVVHLIQATKTVTETIARTEREIALMQEYRTRLTADLVTGKLDVREAAAHLPAPPAAAAEKNLGELLEEPETEEEE